MSVEGAISERILFVTGRLAEPALREQLQKLAAEYQFEYEVVVLGISVAALMHTEWVSRKFSVPKHSFSKIEGDQTSTDIIDRVVLPGWCQGSLDLLSDKYKLPFERGPKDMYDLPMYFGKQKKEPPDLIQYSVEILAEINHAPRMADREILTLSEHYRKSGADMIDLGCIPGEDWSRCGDVTRFLKNEGFRVSVDSFSQPEVTAAVEAGAELVLSCNQTNIEWASKLGVELVAIPDTPRDTASLEKTYDQLSEAGVPFRIDPILEPIGFGFTASLARYYEARRRWPDAEIMMGVGNLTELSEVDSAGINFLLAAVCEELGIRSVLTTEVINWCRSAVQEFDHARRLMHYSLNHKTLPKHLDSSLVVLRDEQCYERGTDALEQMQSQIKDPNFRIFVEQGELHLLNRDGYWHGTDPFELFDEIVANTNSPDPSHSFYLGYELAKAVTALTLGKQYTQDQALNWGFLTVPELSVHERRKKQKSNAKTTKKE